MLNHFTESSSPESREFIFKALPFLEESYNKLSYLTKPLGLDKSIDKSEAYKNQLDIIVKAMDEYATVKDKIESLDLSDMNNAFKLLSKLNYTNYLFVVLMSKPVMNHATASGRVQYLKDTNTLTLLKKSLGIDSDGNETESSIVILSYLNCVLGKKLAAKMLGIHSYDNQSSTVGFILDKDSRNNKIISELQNFEDKENITAKDLPLNKLYVQWSGYVNNSMHSLISKQKRQDTAEMFIKDKLADVSTSELSPSSEAEENVELENTVDDYIKNLLSVNNLIKPFVEHTKGTEFEKYHNPSMIDRNESTYYFREMNKLDLSSPLALVFMSNVISTNNPIASILAGIVKRSFKTSNIVAVQKYLGLDEFQLDKILYLRKLKNTMPFATKIDAFLEKINEYYLSYTGENIPTIKPVTEDNRRMKVFESIYKESHK